ncbi:hypothetical protein PtA15_6A150 [Puccinia triticina]|uniref:Uncharacterized protein n=1 Tax=Puccinia triticina TaxID=208348 RepID=A0ABY7CM11_9BASI|nr:uncharacterized protein PtA15_6A150 [Puccinia triticina]WAQ85522.1 hypothetical protein PtA15_6A150 [Puccinia triticina]WAR55404.1 hypothetical protein PtB15_6B145 [Puccinia triticina]
MSDASSASRHERGEGEPDSLPPSHDQGWISALVDSLVPKFQAQGSTSASDSAMQTDTTQGRPICCGERSGPVRDQ